MLRAIENLRAWIERSVAAHRLAVRSRQVREQFSLLMQAHDDAIERARLKHKPVAPLIQAKRDFLHSCLRKAA